MKLLKGFKTVSGSSIIESIIAVLLISICSLVAFTIYLNVITQNKSTSYYEAKHTIELIHFKTQEEQDLEDDIFKYKNYTIEKQVRIDSKAHIAFIDYIIKSNTKTITVTKLIQIEP